MGSVSKTFIFPKIAFYGGRKINTPEITMKLRDTDKGPELLIYGDVWNSKHTDIVIGGQCLDEMNKFESLKSNPTFRKLYEWWKLYHLNNLKSGGPLQEAALKDRKFSSYEDRCSYLESKGLLYEDGIKYGAQWWYYKIQDDDLKEIKSLLEIA